MDNRRRVLAVACGIYFMCAPSGPCGLEVGAAQAQPGVSSPDISIDDLHTVAEMGIPGPQVMLGMKYLLGQGVEEDHAQAAHWFLRAAETGFGPAQQFIGTMYRDGDGVPQDDVTAYMWLTLAAAQASDESLARLDDSRAELAARMTSRQVAEAQRLAQERAPRAVASAAAPDVSSSDQQPERQQFDKTLLFSNTELARIQSVSVGQFGSDPSVTFAVAGDQGVSFLTRDGVERFFVRFDRRATRTVPIDVDGDGVYEFMGRGGGWSPVGLFDAQGATLWHHDEELSGNAPNAMAAGDLDGDGVLEFVIGMNSRGGIYLVDNQGREVWRRGAVNVFSVDVVDVDADGALDIVHSHVGGRRQGVRIRRGDGEVVQTLWPGFVTFSLTPWPTSDGAPHLLGAARGMVRVVNFLGHEVATFDGAGIGRDMRASPVRFAGASAPHFAVVSSVRRQPASVLHIFASDGSLAHHETLPVRELDLAVLDLEDGQMLVVGGGTEVWTYRLTGD